MKGVLEKHRVVYYRLKYTLWLFFSECLSGFHFGHPLLIFTCTRTILFCGSIAQTRDVTMNITECGIWVLMVLFKQWKAVFCFLTSLGSWMLEIPGGRKVKGGGKFSPATSNKWNSLDLMISEIKHQRHGYAQPWNMRRARWVRDIHGLKVSLDSLNRWESECPRSGKVNHTALLIFHGQ